MEYNEKKIFKDNLRLNKICDPSAMQIWTLSSKLKRGEEIEMNLYDFIY